MESFFNESASRSEVGAPDIEHWECIAADLQPDLEKKTLTVQLHRIASASHDEARKHLCEELRPP